MKETKNIFKTRKELRDKVIELGKEGKLIPEIVEELQCSREFVVETFTNYRKKNLNGNAEI